MMLQCTVSLRDTIYLLKMKVSYKSGIIFFNMAMRPSRVRTLGVHHSISRGGGGGLKFFVAGKLFISTGLDGALKI